MKKPEFVAKIYDPNGRWVFSCLAGRYYSILDTLRDMKVPRQEAYDIAKWAARAKEANIHHCTSVGIIVRIEESE